ncbi:hypothetical protein Sango_1053400 [Sesamum angolense]|uniref:Retrotransposon gag domain-containing protein n=1 Tax=Sesamum angolense TaxID=2727404 RepID=A0AAE2BZ53_9LAMI|nr:hypothetical protein Sango_1053400 [Sesamum angolense]
MVDQTSLRNHVAELESQVKRMMELLGQAPESPLVALFPLLDTLHSRVEMLQKAVGEWPDMLDKRVTSVIEEASILTDTVDVRVDGVQAKVNLLKRVVGLDEDRAPMSKVKVPDPMLFGGARSIKEIENFLWDMETYFQAARILEAEKVSITSMYLTGDAKLWWRPCLSDDASANQDKIKTWDVLKKELKDQFLPCNTSWLVRLSLCRRIVNIQVTLEIKNDIYVGSKRLCVNDLLFVLKTGAQAPYNWVFIENSCSGLRTIPRDFVAHNG